jgi:hypothetical protein
MAESEEAVAMLASRFKAEQVGCRWSNRRRCGVLLLLLVSASLLAGCLVRPLGPATPTPGPHAPTGPDLFEPIVPAVHVSPSSGSADTEVTVDASGFPADWRLFVYIAPPGSGNPHHALGEGTSDQVGRMKMTFPMPATWEDGRPITATQVLVILASQDFYTRAQAAFEFVPQR